MLDAWPLVLSWDNAQIPVSQYTVRVSSAWAEAPLIP